MCDNVYQNSLDQLINPTHYFLFATPDSCKTKRIEQNGRADGRMGDGMAEWVRSSNRWVYRSIQVDDDMSRMRLHVCLFVKKWESENVPLQLIADAYYSCCCCRCFRPRPRHSRIHVENTSDYFFDCFNQ